jgi:2-polyprenyl-3-methyl-5-hydroxy-6-metoxy-1,4-benzoquinol methylase
MVKTMYSLPECGIVGCKLLYPDGTIQHAGVVFDHKGNRCHIYKKYPSHIREAACSRECEAVTGACILIRKDVFCKVEGFDERYIHGSEDIDLCLKVRELGLKVIYCPDSVVTHFEQVSLKAKGGRYKKKTTRHNNRLFFRKWGDRLDEFRLPFSFTGLKPYHYHYHTRREIIELIPAEAKFILDVGCSSGMLGKKLKETNSNATIWGVEINEDIAREAENNIDRVFVMDVEKTDPLFDAPVLFDCIVLADVLEHFKNPWSVLRKFLDYLVPNGKIICSIPNIQHYKVIKDIIRDRWLYRAEGILDIDHLRFFSLSTIKNLFAVSGYKILRIEKNRKAGKLLKALNKLLCNKLDKFLTQQYLIVCERR